LQLRVRLSTLLGQDQYPAELAGWGPVHAELARDLVTTFGGAQWCFAITDEQGQLSHCGVTRSRPTGTPARIAGCSAIVELAVSAATLRALREHVTGVGAWAEVAADLLRQLERGTAGDEYYAGETHRRAPGAGLRRYLEIRDRSCTMIGCRAPARTPVPLLVPVGADWEASEIWAEPPLELAPERQPLASVPSEDLPPF
jgi:hypothetical protein